MTEMAASLGEIQTPPRGQQVSGRVSVSKSLVVWGKPTEFDQMCDPFHEAGISFLVPREHKYQSQCSQRDKWVHFVRFSNTVDGHPSPTMGLTAHQSTYL